MRSYPYQKIIHLQKKPTRTISWRNIHGLNHLIHCHWGANETIPKHNEHHFCVNKAMEERIKIKATSLSIDWIEILNVYAYTSVSEGVTMVLQLINGKPHKMTASGLLQTSKTSTITELTWLLQASKTAVKAHGIPSTAWKSRATWHYRCIGVVFNVEGRSLVSKCHLPVIQTDFCAPWCGPETFECQRKHVQPYLHYLHRTPGRCTVATPLLHLYITPKLSGDIKIAPWAIVSLEKFFTSRSLTLVCDVSVSRELQNESLEK